MLPAPLKKLAIEDVRPVSADRIYFVFHLRSHNSQKPSTVAVWTRGDKKPFPSAKLTHYAHASCLLDGRLLALNSDGPSTAFEGLEASPVETPVIEDNTWMAGAVVGEDLVLGGNWGNLRRRDASGAWHTVSEPDALPRIGSIAVHPNGNAIIAGGDGLLMQLTKAGLEKIEHGKGSADFREVCCRADGTIVAVTNGAFVHGALGTTLAGVEHPARKDFLSVAEAGGTLYLTADDGLYQYAGGALQAVACPISPTPLLTLRTLGDALYVFNEDAAYLRTGGDWTQVA